MLDVSEKNLKISYYLFKQLINLGNIITIPSKNIKFEYRKNDLSDDLIFLSASFKV